MVFAVFGEDFDLVLDAVAVPLVLVVAGEPDIKGCPFFALVIVLPVHHSLQSGSAQVLLEEGWSPRSIDIGLQAHRREIGRAHV